MPDPRPEPPLSPNHERFLWDVMRSRNTLLALFDGLPHSVYIVDPDYRLIAVNQASSLTAAGRPPQALVGRVCYQALYARQEPCVGCRMGETLAGGLITRRTERRREADDRVSEWEISTYPIHDEAGAVGQVIVFGEDVTEKRRLEASLAQAEKLAALGQLAAGVAHEINNPLAAIIANTQLLQRELPADNADWQESLDLIARAGDRAQRVVRGLLDLARQEAYEFSTTDVNQSLDHAIALIQHQLVAGAITLIREYALDLPLIAASRDHLQGVWLNLMLNARDALKGKPGEIRVTTRRQDDAVMVAIADTGEGIAPEKLARIFEPFFTTKAPGRGTGLGLSVVHRIVQQHGGQITAESQMGKGTTFVVRLPLDAAEA